MVSVRLCLMFILLCLKAKKDVELTQEYIKRRKLEDPRFDKDTCIVDYNKKLKDSNSKSTHLPQNLKMTSSR